MCACLQSFTQHVVGGFLRGEEAILDELRDLSLIAAGYRFGRRSGSLGILGPTRMDYPAVISTVAEVASTLSRVLRQLGS